MFLPYDILGCTSVFEFRVSFLFFNRSSRAVCTYRRFSSQFTISKGVQARSRAVSPVSADPFISWCGRNSALRGGQLFPSMLCLTTSHAAQHCGEPADSPGFGASVLMNICTDIPLLLCGVPGLGQPCNSARKNNGYEPLRKAASNQINTTMTI